jgi:hypothetical protein
VRKKNKTKKIEINIPDDLELIGRNTTKAVPAKVIKKQKSIVKNKYLKVRGDSL